MPGHKLGKGIPPELAQDLLQLDVTEVEGTDNLHYPEGIIKEAQHQAAMAFGADETFFLVNGSTCGIQAAIMSVCARGQKIILGRDSHRAVVSGLILSGAAPVFVYPEYNEEFAVTAEITPESIEHALRSNPDAAAVLITRPNYYGICGDIEKISSLVHSYGRVLIVDEAHGAHLAFSPRLPDSAVKHGADICIQSAHKTLPAVTQGAYLHVKGGRIDVDRLRFNLSLLQTSSPSYIIMSYLDIARELMASEGGERLEVLTDNLGRLVQEIEKCGVYKVLSHKYLGINTVHDPTRLVVNMGKLGISGYYAEKVLRDSFRIQAEMADYENVVFITTVADNRETLNRLLEAMKVLAEMEFPSGARHSGRLLRETIKNQYGRMAYNTAGEEAPEGPKGGRSAIAGNLEGIFPWEAYSAQREEAALEESAGRICAETVTPYPPGIPALYPGELIDGARIKYISAIEAAGGTVNGMKNGRIRVVARNDEK